MVDTERTAIYGNSKLAKLMVDDEINNFLFLRPGHYSTDVPGYLASLRATLISPKGEQLFSRAFTQYTAGDSLGRMIIEAGNSTINVHQRGALDEVINELDRRLRRPLSSGMGREVGLT